MKPFNLQLALAGKPVVTRDGRKVAEIYHFKTLKSDYTVHASIDGYNREYTTEGMYYNNGSESVADLFMEEPVVEKWVNIYCHNKKGDMWIGELWSSYKEAIDSKGDDAHYIKTIKINNQPE